MIDSAIKLPENRIHLFDPVGLINDNYASHGIRVRRSTRSFDGGSQLRFAVETNREGEDSEASSPRLWKTSSPNIPRPTPGGSPPHHHPHQPMSPNSRTQAIARGRRELMDMIKNMPESFYELSLRDIVEHKSLPPADHETSKGKVDDEIKFPAMEYPDEKQENETQNQKQRKIGKKVSKSESNKKMVRSRSIDNSGFLLKTSVFPISFGLSMKKKKSLSTSGSLKVAPKPPLHAPASASSKAVKSAEKDWWKKKSCISSESENTSAGLSSSNSGSGRSSASSSRSSSTSSRRGHSCRFLPVCCSFKAKK